MNIYTCCKCGDPYDAGVSLAKRHACEKPPTAAKGQDAAAEWRKSLGWREGHGFSGVRRQRRDERIAAVWAVLSGLSAVVSMLSGVKVGGRTDWVKAARQPRAGGFGAGGDGGSAGD